MRKASHYVKRGELFFLAAFVFKLFLAHRDAFAGIDNPIAIRLAIENQVNQFVAARKSLVNRVVCWLTKDCPQAITVSGTDVGSGLLANALQTSESLDAVFVVFTSCHDWDFVP